MKRTTKTTKKKVSQELKEQEFKKYLEKVEDPNYQGGS